MEEIVRRLRNRNPQSLRFLKESMSLEGLNEEDEENNEEVDTSEEEVTAPEEEVTSDDETSSGDELDIPSVSNSPDSGEEESEEDIATPDDELPAEEENKENVNPLDNPYAVKYALGQEVAMTYSDGTKTKLKGVVDGYDSEGFYRIQWANGMTTNGMTDIALADFVDGVQEQKCICGGTKFVDEEGNLVCDSCGRMIGESVNHLSIADKKRPAGKKLIRSEAHPVSTTMQDSIRNAFNKKKINEDIEEDQRFNDLRDKLEGEFWTRLSELVEDIEQLGYDVLDYNDEYVVVALDDETEVQINLGGTSRTMTLDFDRVRMA